MTESFDAVVVGAGPAGSAAATILAGTGRSVLLLEKDVFPRHKVCGEFLSADALPSLDRLGVREEVEGATTERMGRGALHLPSGRLVPFLLPHPALGISRFRLDDLLARRAGGAGADLRFDARVLAARQDRLGFRVRFTHGKGECDVEARAVIGAWGGETAFLAGEVRLYLFAGGYCGLSRVEGGAINLAGIVSERTRSRSGRGWEGVMDRARGGNPALDADLAKLTPGPIGFLGTGPVFFTAKPPTENEILMVGDAAGVFDPFSGEGQAAALVSGILAAETAERLLSGELSREDCARVYSTAWRRRFAKRFAWSAAFRRLMLNRWIGAVAGRVAGKSLVRFAIAATRH